MPANASMTRVEPPNALPGRDASAICGIFLAASRFSSAFAAAGAGARGLDSS